MWARALMTTALRGPGKGLLLASAAGWIATAWLLARDPMPHMPASHSPKHFATVWLAMILAMAPPLLLREIGYLWRTSLRRLRSLTIAWFVSGYVGVWMLAGVVLLALFESIAASPERIAGALVLFAVWHCSPARQRCLNACHRVPTLRVFGTAAQLGSLRYGIATGYYCVATCGVLMLLVFLASEHHFAVMALMAAMTTLERHLPARRPRWGIPIVRRSLEWTDMAVPAPSHAAA
jgi:predicted metal-binding membrane protein